MQTENQDTTSEKNLAAFGLYTNKKEAECAIGRLEKNGFLRNDISMLAPERSGKRDFVYEQKTCIKDGAVVGSVGGFFIFGFAGFLWSISGRSVMIENTLPFWFISTIVGSLMGLIFGAAAGALVGIGIPKSAAKRYGFYLNEGGIVLSVHLKNEADRKIANQILQTTHAQDISELHENEIWTKIIPEKRKLNFNT